jgi:polar amino acid transport system ATP-binding protein
MTLTLKTVPRPEAVTENSSNIAHPSSEEMLVSIRGLRKSFGQHVVFENLSLDVKKGEVIAIVGPSGSGKSTLLRCINLLEEPDCGQLRVGDTEIDFANGVVSSHRRALRRNLGMVFQSFNLFPHMNVLENISLPQRRVLGRAKKEADKIGLDLLQKVGLLEKASASPTRCSGGQQQRIAIARALAMNPLVMLFDEPTSSLDPELGLEVLGVMTELAKSGMTLIVVTHEIGFAENVSDRTIVMADGNIVEQGPSQNVIRDPQTERAKRFFSAVNNR